MDYCNKLIRDAYKSDLTVDSRVNSLKEIKDYLQAGYNSGNRDLQFYIQTVDETIKLLKYQVELEKQTTTNIFLDTSLVDTVYNMVFMGNTKAVKVKTDFKMSDPSYIIILFRFWNTKIRALSDIRDWNNLSYFANEKKSPIGYMPFARACIDKGEYDQAAIYVQKLTDNKEKIAVYISIKKWKEATDLAYF